VWWRRASRVAGLLVVLVVLVLRARQGMETVRQLKASLPVAGMVWMVETRFGSGPGMGLTGFARAQSVRGRPRRRGRWRAMRGF
jgi:hypothetical protein